MGNVNFRITTSKWLEAFKSSQTFALNQLVRGEHPFQPTSQEVLIDVYDVWFDWLRGAEQQLSRAGHFTASERSGLAQGAQAVLVSLRRRWAENSLLDAKLLALWLRTYQPAHVAYVDHLQGLPDSDHKQAFTAVAERLLSLLQHGLLTLHEVDSLLYRPGTNNFISVDDYECTVYNQQGRDLLNERLSLYKQLLTGGPEATKPWQVKEYVNVEIPAALRDRLNDRLEARLAH